MALNLGRLFGRGGSTDSVKVLDAQGSGTFEQVTQSTDSEAVINAHTSAFDLSVYEDKTDSDIASAAIGPNTFSGMARDGAQGATASALVEDSETADGGEEGVETGAEEPLSGGQPSEPSGPVDPSGGSDEGGARNAIIFDDGTGPYREAGIIASPEYFNRQTAGDDTSDAPGLADGQLLAEAQYNPKELGVDKSVPWARGESGRTAWADEARAEESSGVVTDNKDPDAAIEIEGAQGPLKIAGLAEGSGTQLEAENGGLDTVDEAPEFGDAARTAPSGLYASNLGGGLLGAQADHPLQDDLAFRTSGGNSVQEDVTEHVLNVTGGLATPGYTATDDLWQLRDGDRRALTVESTQGDEPEHLAGDRRAEAQDGSGTDNANRTMGPGHSAQGFQAMPELDANAAGQPGWEDSGHQSIHLDEKTGDGAWNFQVSGAGADLLRTGSELGRGEGPSGEKVQFEDVHVGRLDAGRPREVIEFQDGDDMLLSQSGDPAGITLQTDSGDMVTHAEGWAGAGAEASALDAGFTTSDDLVNEARGTAGLLPHIEQAPLVQGRGQPFFDTYEQGTDVSAATAGEGEVQPDPTGNPQTFAGDLNAHGLLPYLEQDNLVDPNAGDEAGHSLGEAPGFDRGYINPLREPGNLEYPNLAAAKNEVSIESLEIAHEGLHGQADSDWFQRQAAPGGLHTDVADVNGDGPPDVVARAQTSTNDWSLRATGTGDDFRPNPTGDGTTQHAGFESQTRPHADGWLAVPEVEDEVLLTADAEHPDIPLVQAHGEQPQGFGTYDPVEHLKEGGLRGFATTSQDLAQVGSFGGGDDEGINQQTPADWNERQANPGGPAAAAVEFESHTRPHNDGVWMPEKDDEVLAVSSDDDAPPIQHILQAREAGSGTATGVFDDTSSSESLSAREAGSGMATGATERQAMQDVFVTESRDGGHGPLGSNVSVGGFGGGVDDDRLVRDGGEASLKEDENADGDFEDRGERSRAPGFRPVEGIGAETESTNARELALDDYLDAAAGGPGAAWGASEIDLKELAVERGTPGAQLKTEWITSLHEHDTDADGPSHLLSHGRIEAPAAESMSLNFEEVIATPDDDGDPDGQDDFDGIDGDFDAPN